MTDNKRFRVLRDATILAVVLLVVTVIWVMADTPPNTISYQGYLTDASDNAIDGSRDMQVVLYTVSTGGTGVYTETHSSVTVSDGQFNLQLGTGTTSDTWDTDVDFSQALWLEITVAGETLTPRIPLSTVPYARYAHSIADNSVTPNKLKDLTGGTSGQVLTFDGADGFAWADDQTGGGGGDVTDVGDSTGPTAFTGANDGNSLTFEGSTNDGNEITLTAADPGADVTITLPATTGTVVTTGDTGTVNSTMIAAGTIVAGDMATGAVATAEILDNTVTATDLSATLTFADSDLLNLSAVDASGTGEGLILPQAANVSSATAEGQISWDSDGDALVVGTGGGQVTLGGGGGGDFTDVNAGSGLSVSAGDAAGPSVTLAVSVDNSTVQVGGIGLEVMNSGITSSKIADDTITATDLNANLTFADGDKIDLSAIIGVDSINEGLFLPSNAGTPTGADAEGQITWDSLNDKLYVGTSSGVQEIGPGPLGPSIDTSEITDGTILNEDINSSAAIADTKLATISTSGKVSNSATTATNANTASPIVARDGSGNFSAGTITAQNLTVFGIVEVTGVTTLSDHLDLAAGKDIRDANDNELLAFPNSAVGSAVNELTISNAATGNSPTISATGGDTNVSLTLNTKGTGKVGIAKDGTTAYSLPNADGLADQVLSTDGSGNLSWATDQTGSGADTALSNLASVAINTSLIADTDDTDDLGSASKEWKDLYIDGTANIDLLVADTADINGGSVDNSVVDNSIIGGSTPAAGTFTDLTANGNSTLGDADTDNITLAGAIQGGTPLVLDGATDDTNETILAVTNPDADRTITLPNASGTVALEPEAGCASGKVLKSDGSSNWTCEDDATGGGSVSYYSASTSSTNVDGNYSVYVACSAGSPIGGGCRDTNVTGAPSIFHSCPATGERICSTSNPTGWSCEIFNNNSTTVTAYVICM